MKSPLRDCRGAVEALSDLLEGRASRWTACKVRLHLRLCRTCRAYFRQFRRVHECCGRVEPEQLPPDFEKVMERVLKSWKKPG